MMKSTVSQCSMRLVGSKRSLPDGAAARNFSAVSKFGVMILLQSLFGHTVTTEWTQQAASLFRHKTIRAECVIASGRRQQQVAKRIKARLTSLTSTGRNPMR